MSISQSSIMAGENNAANKHPRDEEDSSSSSGGMLNIDEADALSQKMQRRLAELQADSKALQGRWKDRLSEVQSAVRHGDDKLRERSSAIARDRYGEADANMYSPEPPAITSLVSLSTRAEDEVAFAERIERFTIAGGSCKKMLLGALAEAKAKMAAAAGEEEEEGGKETVRHLGRCLNAINKIMRTGRDLDRPVGRRITAAMKRLTTYRTSSRVRTIRPENLASLPANTIGYRKILDYYRLSCASSYSFGRQLDGPQHFVDVRRNVAILSVFRKNQLSTASTASSSSSSSSAECTVYNQWAISGESPVGAPPPPSPACRRCFDSVSCVDGLGEVYDRALDAEYKLITDFVTTIFVSGEEYRAVLWSKKPLCASCSAVLLRQLPERYPSIALTVLIDDDERGRNKDGEKTTE